MIIAIVHPMLKRGANKHCAYGAVQLAAFGIKHPNPGPGTTNHNAPGPPEDTY
jgi:hypothetical protein